MSCIIGVSFNDKAYILDVEEEEGLEEAGLSVIKWLQRDKTAFVSEIFKFQSEGSIKAIFDDKFISSHNIEYQNDFQEVSLSALANAINLVDYVYLYLVEKDLLLIKTLIIPELIALDYKNLIDLELYFSEHDITLKI